MCWVERKKLFVLKNNNVKIEKFDIERIKKKLTEERKKEYEKLIEDYKEVKENLKKLIGLKRILEK